MAGFENRDYKIFDLFRNQWALVTAGNPEHFNTCTVSWGSMGTLWSRSVITIYLHPSRYTTEFFLNSATFTVSFFPAAYKKAL
ncbi:MAG: flavin reductase family protein, partial [Eggerthellaceae bacterium]|nr:flavin reductase family protein [Eggerthellaceae bacterium]